MRVALIDFTETAGLGIAASWLKWECTRRGVELVPDGTPGAAFALATGFWPFAAEAARVRTRPLIVGGTDAPAGYGDSIDCACVGSGTRFLDVLFRDGLAAAKELPEAWVPGETRPVIPYQAHPWGVPPIRFLDGSYRVWASVGCRRKCLFCQTGWSREFLSHPDPDLLAAQVDTLRRCGRKVQVSTNDGAADFGLIVAARQKYVSASAAAILAISPAKQRTLPRSIRVGVEGLSERLRRAVRKPIADDELLELLLRMKAVRGRRAVRFFMIVGLPGETQSDWEEFRGLMRRIAVVQATSPLAFEFSFTAFSPQPATPLGVLPLTDEYDPRWVALDAWRRDGGGFIRGGKWHRPRGAVSRLIDAQNCIAASESELRRGWMQHEQPNWRIQYPHATPEELRKIARAYAAEVGLALPASRGGG